MLRPALLAGAEDFHDDLTAALAGMTQWRKHGRERLAARRCWGQRALVEVRTVGQGRACATEAPLDCEGTRSNSPVEGSWEPSPSMFLPLCTGRSVSPSALYPAEHPASFLGGRCQANSEPLHGKRASRTRVQARSCPGNPSRVRSGRRQHATIRCVRS